MLLRISLVCLLALCCTPSFAQSPYLDSLTQQLSTKQSDSSRIETLLKLADLLVYDNPPDALSYAIEADTLCDSLAHPLQWARAQLILGDQLETKGEMEIAMLKKLNSIAALEAAQNQKELAKGYISLARIAHAFN